MAFIPDYSSDVLEARLKSQCGLTLPLVLPDI